MSELRGSLGTVSPGWLWLRGAAGSTESLVLGLELPCRRHRSYRSVLVAPRQLSSLGWSKAAQPAPNLASGHTDESLLLILGSYVAIWDAPIGFRWEKLEEIGRFLLQREERWSWLERWSSFPLSHTSVVGKVCFAERWEGVKAVRLADGPGGISPNWAQREGCSSPHPSHPQSGQRGSTMSRPRLRAADRLVPDPCAKHVVHWEAQVVTVQDPPPAHGEQSAPSPLVGPNTVEAGTAGLWRGIHHCPLGEGPVKMTLAGLCCAGDEPVGSVELGVPGCWGLSAGTKPNGVPAGHRLPTPVCPAGSSPPRDWLQTSKQQHSKG